MLYTMFRLWEEKMCICVQMSHIWTIIVLSLAPNPDTYLDHFGDGVHQSSTRVQLRVNDAALLGPAAESALLLDAAA